MILNPHIERKCKSEQCDTIISKESNPKKLFCSLSCKNRFHYESTSIDDAIFENHINHIKRNRKILTLYILDGIYKLEKHIMQRIGFNRKAYMGTKMIKRNNENKFKVYVIDGICYWYKDGYCYFNFLETIEDAI